MGKSVLIREGTLEEVVALSMRIEEFNNPHQIAEYTKRLTNVPSLILVACVREEVVGFKVGYEREQNGAFYSWMGGVLAQWRRKGIAAQLAEAQEAWASNRGYNRIQFKTRNSHKAMLIFGLSRGFKIIELDTRKQVDEHRILLEKYI